MSFFNASGPVVSEPVVLSPVQVLIGEGKERLLATSLLVLTLSFALYWKNSKTIRVPSECVSSYLPRYFGAYHFLTNAKQILDEAYKKYEGGTFKVPFLNRWIVVISKEELIEEIKKAPDDKISITDALVDFMAVPWTIGINIATRHYHLEIVRQQLTRSLASRFSDVRNEIIQSFDDLIPVCDDKWVSVPVLKFARNVVCRTSNRVFIGLPLCRNPEYIDLNIDFAISVIETGIRMSKFPHFMRPIVGPLITSTPKRIRRSLELLGPIIEERMRQYAENGKDWEGKPNDMLTWIMEEAPAEERSSPYELTKRMLWINFPAIHTSSNAFTQALFHLAAEPWYIQPLRDEIESVISKEGWSKVAMTKMWKLDSFLKESQRLHGVNMLPMNRKVMADHTLSDGTFLPRGTFVSINAMSNHYNDKNYADAASFDGFRFSRKRESSTEDEAKHQMVATSSDYLAFGYGKHACPGRFFAVNELKAMMAYLLLNYDVKMENEGVRPKDTHLGTRIAPNPVAEVLFRKRKN